MVFGLTLFLFFFFFFNDTATTEIYTLSLHDALPIFEPRCRAVRTLELERRQDRDHGVRSEEHTSELQSRQYLVCRLLLEKKKKKNSKRRRNSGDKHRTVHGEITTPQ